MARSEMHNPVTYNLIQQLDDPVLAEFAAYWDALEALNGFLMDLLEEQKPPSA
jgi:hypothetical protein